MNKNKGIKVNEIRSEVDFKLQKLQQHVATEKSSIKFNGNGEDNNKVTYLYNRMMVQLKEELLTKGYYELIKNSKCVYPYKISNYVIQSIVESLTVSSGFPYIF
jgi:hypothetical protein